MSGLLGRLVDKMRMLRDDAAAVASVVEDAFQGQAEVADEVLDKEVRQVFYDLQDQDILEVRRAEHDEKGQTRRDYFWRLRDDPHVLLPEPAQVRDAAQRLYARLGDEAWERRRPGA